MKRSGEIEPTSVFALLAGARCASAALEQTPSESSVSGRLNDERLARARPANEQPATLGAPPRLGDVPAVFTTLDEARAAIEAAASSAQRMISIYTPDLEPDLYDQSAFLEIIKRFVLSRSFTKVRVLLADPARVVRDSNRFAAMGRRLSSYIDIRHSGEAQATHRARAVPHASSAAAYPQGVATPVSGAAAQGCGAATQSCAYLIADDRAIVYRLRADTWDGIADFNNPPVARLYLTEFDALWALSTPEDALRAARARA